eukprot:s615_g36.t2
MAADVLMHILFFGSRGVSPLGGRKPCRPASHHSPSFDQKGRSQTKAQAGVHNAMLGLPDNAVHMRPKGAFRSLVVAVLMALAPQGSNATLKAKLSTDAHLTAGDWKEAARAGTLQVGEATVAENVEFLSKTLSRFRSFALTAQQSVEERHANEAQRLQEAVAQAKDPKVKTALQQSVTSNKEALDETKSIYSNIVTFSDSMLSLLKKTSSSGNCDQLICGLHASCAETLSGASCVCDEGYIGQGKDDCKPPAAFAPHLLLGENAVHASDIHVTAFDGNKIAVVFRDENKGNAGALVVGTVEEAGSVELSPLELFTAPGAAAFSPVVAGSDGQSLAIAWRDNAKSGTCRLRAAKLGASGIRGAEMVPRLEAGAVVDGVTTSPAGGSQACTESFSPALRAFASTPCLGLSSPEVRESALSSHSFASEARRTAELEKPQDDLVMPEDAETWMIGVADCIDRDVALLALRTVIDGRLWNAEEGVGKEAGATSVAEAAQRAKDAKAAWATNALTWGPAMDFCNGQAHKMSIQAFDKNRFVVLYSDKARGPDPDPARTESFGNSILADVGEAGNVSVLGNFRFTDSAVARLEAAKVSKNGFVLAARASPAIDEMSPQPVKQEAMAMYGELVGEDLVFDPNPVNLEPTEGQIWARGISLIAPNTLAYAYQDGRNQQLKIAVLNIHPQTHRMQVAQAPVSLGKGSSPYVSMLSLPYSASDPYAMTYFQGEDGANVLNICGMNAEQKLQNCEDFPWLNQKVSTVSGASIGEGRVVMAFATPSGVPYYSLVGLSKK